MRYSKKQMLWDGLLLDNPVKCTVDLVEVPVVQPSGPRASKISKTSTKVELWR